MLRFNNSLVVAVEKEKQRRKTLRDIVSERESTHAQNKLVHMRRTIFSPYTCTGSMASVNWPSQGTRLYHHRYLWYRAFSAVVALLLVEWAKVG